MRVHTHIPVGEIAASMPHATKLFDLMGIDYVQHGQLSLRDACAEAGADPATVKQALEAMPSSPDDPNWADEPMQTLLEELRDRRHPVLHESLAQVAFAIADLPPNAAALALRAAFNALSEVLQPHLTREEHTLYPVIQHLEDCWTKNEPVSMRLLGGLKKPIASLVLEHAAILEKVESVRAAAEATPLAQTIDALAQELRLQFHLENNVLFPRACAVEAALPMSA